MGVCSVLRVHRSKPAKSVYFIPASRRYCNEPAACKHCKPWQHGAFFNVCTEMGLSEGTERTYLFYRLVFQQEVNFWAYKECTKYVSTCLLRLLALMVKLNSACKELTASVSSSCFCLTREKHFQPWDLKAPFSWRNRLLTGACDCWLIWSMLS